MSGKKSKKLRQEVKRLIGSQYFDLYNSLCSQPFKRRFVTAGRILLGIKLKVK